MRTLVDIPEDELEELNSLSRSRKVSRAELIRQAVAGFLAENRSGIEDSFGIWKQRDVDGVEYQEKLPPLAELGRQRGNTRDVSLADMGK